MPEIKQLLPMMQLVRIEDPVTGDNFQTSFVVPIDNYVIESGPTLMPEDGDTTIINMHVRFERGASTPLSDTLTTMQFRAQNPVSAEGQLQIKVYADGGETPAAASAMNYDDADDPEKA